MKANAFLIHFGNYEKKKVEKSVFFFFQEMTIWAEKFANNLPIKTLSSRKNCIKKIVFFLLSLFLDDHIRNIYMYKRNLHN